MPVMPEATLIGLLTSSETVLPDLAAHSAILSQIADAAGCGQWYFDIERRRMWANRAYYAMLGYNPGDVKLDSAWVRAQIHPDDLAPAIEVMELLIAGDTTEFHVDYRLRHKDGSYKWFEASARRLDRSSIGLPDLIFGSLFDITRRKADERCLTQALETAEAAYGEALVYREMMQSSSLCGGVAHWTFCPELDSGWAPETTYALLGYEADAFPSTHAGWRSLIHPDDLPGTASSMDNLVCGSSNLHEHEHRLRHADGTYHWYRAVARRVDRSDEGLPFLLAGALVNIDHEKENERRLASSAAYAKQARDRLNTLADNSQCGLVEYHISRDGSVNLSYFSGKFPEIMGITKSHIEADPRTLEANVNREDYKNIISHIEKAKLDLAPFSFTCRVQHPRKGQRRILASVNPVSQSDGSVIFYSSVIDITEQYEAEERATIAAEQAEQARKWLESIADIAPVGLYEFRRDTHGNVSFPYTSGRFNDLMGYERDEIEALQAGIFERVVPEDRSKVLETTDKSVRHLKPWRLRFRINHPKRGLIWLEGASIPRREEIDGSVVWSGALHDVTKDVEREAQLKRAHQLAEEMRTESEHRALHDGLTGLPNRRYYDQMMATRMSSASSGLDPGDCALVRLDLDHFKYVNDTLGHEAGDAVLAHVADVLRSSIRVNDFAARIGGDEFSIILAPHTTRQCAQDIVAHIQGVLAKPFYHNGRPCRFGASFGVARVDNMTEDGCDLQLFADAALYKAKRTGRNRMQFFTPELHNDFLNDRRIASDIHDALERDEFLPYFQPQICAKTGLVFGVEALLRWHHPVQGLLAPGAFMHVLQQLQLMPDVQRIMLIKADEALARWQAKGMTIPRISFNVSSEQIHDPDVLALAGRMAVGETQVAFELLESIFVEEESEDFHAHVDKIRTAGIDIEVDDFGSGHASIIGLMQISPSALKIDRRIVAPVVQESRSRELVRAIIEIANTLGIRTVAEGVETEQQAECLRRMGCDVLQGYLFARPIGHEDFLEYARKQGVLCKVRDASGPDIERHVDEVTSA